jgi:glutamate dehydrogenase (NAD(P)+)
MYREAAPQLDMKPSETTFVMQGYGNVGSWAARIMQQLGAKMVGVADADGAIHSEEGIDADKLAEITADGGSVTDYEGADELPAEDLIAIDCDVFVPAALGGMIHKQNADRLQAKMVLEAANSPTTPAADDILADKGVLVVPDVMANAGGVVVSYFEWAQNLQHFRWDEREVNDRLGRMMRKAFREVSARAKEGKVPLRIAAYEQGIERVVDAATTRGYI